MKANNITIKFKRGKSFTISQNDCEQAPCPICMQLVNDEVWKEVAKELERRTNDNSFGYDSEDDFEDFLWAEYENIVLHYCKVFYYEDMTDDEYNKFSILIDEHQKDMFAHKVYDRIKRDNQ